VNGLSLMLSSDSAIMHDLSRSAFPELLSALLISLAAYIGACPPVNIARKENKSRSMAFVPNRDAYGLVPGRQETCACNANLFFYIILLCRVALEACQALLTATGFSTLNQSFSECRVEVGESLETFMSSTQNLIR